MGKKRRKEGKRRREEKRKKNGTEGGTDKGREIAIGASSAAIRHGLKEVFKEIEDHGDHGLFVQDNTGRNAHAGAKGTGGKALGDATGGNPDPGAIGLGLTLGIDGRSGG
jgi:hypothetical protein